MGKKIALLGCGTIGGYLADLLVRSGAGSDGGELTLVDQDILTSANLGRHILALPFLGENKAVGMARKIQNDFPDTQVKPLPVDLRKAYLGETDLIIDATGSEAISLWISRKYSDKKHFIPKLHVWVEGAGTAIKGLMHDRPEAGCYVCFRQGLRDATNLGLSSLKDPNALIHQYDGCDSLFVPFPASVSMEAAALASKMVTDWVNGILGARLRARVIDNTAGREINEQDILHQPGCGLIV